MNWFLVALINPLALGFINHFDKFLLSKYVKGGSVGALIIFSALFAVFALPILYFISPEVLTSVTFVQAAILMVNGAFLTVAILLYLYALDTDEASYVAPLFQLTPVLGLLFGFLVLGEYLTTIQTIAGGLIVLGSLLLSLELSGGKTKLKKKLIFLMFGSSFFYAINAVIFKYVAIDLGFVHSVFWDMFGKFLFGVILFLSIKSYREQFLNLMRMNGAKVAGLNVVNEIIGLIGEFSLVLAVLYAPVALVQSVSGFQPLFVLVMGVLITKFLPSFGQEKLEKRFLAQKIIGVIIISIGVYFLGVI